MTNKNNLPTSPQQLLQVFDDINLSYDLHHHDAVFSVKDAERVERNIKAAHCRNLFLRDKKKKMFLVTAQNETPIDLKKLEKRLSCARLSFGSAERLFEYLGVRPGSVCPFSVINDKNQQVSLILEKDMMDQPLVSYHPLLNEMTVVLTPDDLIRFLEHIGHAYDIIDLRCVRPDE